MRESVPFSPMDERARSADFVRERRTFFVFCEPPVRLRAPKNVGGLGTCAELSVLLKEVTRRALEELLRNHVDLGIPPQNCANLWCALVARHFVLVRVLWLLGVLLLCSCVARRLCV